MMRTQVSWRGRAPSSGRRPLFLFAVDPVLDGAAAVRAIEAFRNVRDRAPIVWLDLSGVKTASPAGLEALGVFAESARRGQVTVRLIGVTSELRAALAGTPLERYLWQPPAASA